MVHLQQADVRIGEIPEQGKREEGNPIVQPYQLDDEIPLGREHGDFRLYAGLPQGRADVMVGGELRPQQHELLVLQFRQGDSLPLCQRMMDADHQVGDVLNQGTDIEPILRHRRDSTPHVQHAGFHICHDPLGTVLLDLQLHIGIEPGEVGNQVAEKTDPRHIRKAQEYLALAGSFLNLWWL